MTDAAPDSQQYPEAGDPPPHLVPAGMMRPVEGTVIHVRIPGRCIAAMVVNVDSEDPLGAVFTVDAVAFQPPMKGKDRFEKANTRPGSVRWANNLSHAEPGEDKPLTWHMVGRGCLPAVVMELLDSQQQGQQP